MKVKKSILFGVVTIYWFATTQLVDYLYIARRHKSPEGLIIQQTFLMYQIIWIFSFGYQNRATVFIITWTVLLKIEKLILCCVSKPNFVFKVVVLNWNCDVINFYFWLPKDSYRDGRNTPHWSLKIGNQ